jgi:hypothetical protein
MNNYLTINIKFTGNYSLTAEKSETVVIIIIIIIIIINGSINLCWELVAFQSIGLLGQHNTNAE